MKKFMRIAKRALRVVIGRDIWVNPDYNCAFECLGSSYGGWNVVCGLLDKDAVVYSFGIGEDASFDIALIERFGMVVHAFDPTPQSIAWVLRQGFPSKFNVHEYGLANFDGNVSFNPPKNPAHVSHSILGHAGTAENSISVPMKRLTTIMRDLGHDRIELLKLDIEGAEYSVIYDLCESEIRPRQLLVEFHHRFPSVGAGKTRDAVSVLRSLGYRLFSVSDAGDEYSFIFRTS